MKRKTQKNHKTQTSVRTRICELRKEYMKLTFIDLYSMELNLQPYQCFCPDQNRKSDELSRMELSSRSSSCMNRSKIPLKGTPQMKNMIVIV